MDKKQQPTENRKNNRVINLIILDESGSMISIYNAALKGMNTTIENIKQQQKECPEIEQRVNIVTFNTEGIKHRYRNVPANETRPFTGKDFQPDACTPLFDAMGKSLVKLEPHVTANDAVVVTIITDGFENSSTEFSGYEIKKLIDRLTEKGWLFTYIGANQDAEKVGLDMGIKMNLNFDATEEDTAVAYEKMAESRTRFNQRLRLAREQTNFHMSNFMADEVDSQKNYFDE